MKIAIVGTGYVGLVAGTCFANTGNHVICVDNNPDKVKSLNSGNIPIFEPGLEGLVNRCTKQGRLSFTTDIADAVKNSEIIFMAVGTPPLPNGEPDLSYLQAASESVAAAMDGYRLIVNKSTVPVGTHKTVANWVSAKTKHPFDVVSNPEFMKEGAAIDDFLKPDRVVIGTKEKKAYEKMAELYAPFVMQGHPIIWMDPISAELTKYACNSYLATRVSFINELSILCEKVGGDIESVRKGMISDTRIGTKFLYPGPGYGGSCFPKDVQALVSTGKKYGKDMEIIEAAERANLRQKKHVAAKIIEHFKGNMKGKEIGIWGIAFKPNTDDIREAPALTIIEDLLEAGATIRVFDPVAMENTKATLGQSVQYAESNYGALEGADAFVLLTEWNEFKHPDFAHIKSIMREPTIFDGRNIYPSDRLRKDGFTFYGIGR